MTKPGRLRIALISLKGPLYRTRGGIFRKSLRYMPWTLPTLASLVPPELDAKVTCIDEGIEEVDLDIDADLIGITVITGTATQTANLTLGNRPLPDQSVLPEKRFIKADVFEATRSCIHNCSFCVVPSAWGRNPLHQPVNEIIADMRLRHTGAPTHVALTTNLGYRYYARRLDRFYNCDWMLQARYRKRLSSGEAIAEPVTIGGQE